MAFIRWSFLAIAAACAACPGPASGEGSFPYKYRASELANGLKVVAVPMDSPGLVAYWTIVRTGSRDEVEPGKSGFAHFFEHMMFRGTRKYPAPVYEDIVTGLGAAANAYTTDDYTAYHLQFAKEGLETVMAIESDRFRNLDYSEEAFQTEAGAIYGEYRKSVTQPFFFLEEKLRDTAYNVHTYKHTTMGFEADVKAMPGGYQYSRSFFERFYRPENTTLLIVGDVDPSTIFALAKKYYGDWQPGYTPSLVKPEPPQQGERYAEVSYPGPTLPILTVAYHGTALDPGNRDFAAARLLEDLAFGQSSPLYNKLVLEEQKVEFLYANFPLNRDAPLFEVSAMVKKMEDIPYVREEISRTLENFKTEPIDPARLEAVKSHDKYGFLMRLDAPNRVAEALARFIGVAGGVDVVDQLFCQMQQVTPQDIMRATKKYFDASRRTVVVLKGVQR
ncbi:MAG: insulinase family protein [Rhodopirellula sp.]|nr:insulinase family protein [Rhodopirellula sp.]